jgi:NADPH2:quinone reductase
MKAASFNSFGAASDVLQISQLDKPQPADGEVLIRLQASGVNPSDVKKRQGAFPNLLDSGAVIPNSDGAGVIEAVGMGVPHSRIGERVWVYQAQFARQWGTAAQYIAIDSSRAATLPDNTSFAQGACLGIPAMTAHRCVFADGSVEGQILFITGGAGRVAHYAIQWAKHSGATVITTASNDISKQHCIAAGADYVVDHTDPLMVSKVLNFTAQAKVDRVIDVEFGANLNKSLELLKVGGVIASYSSTVVPEPTLPFKQMMFMDLTIRLVIVYAMPETAKQAAIADIANALQHNKLQHRIAAQYPLDGIAQANDKIEQAGVYGCVVIDID